MEILTGEPDGAHPFVFRVKGRRAVLVRTVDLLDLAGAVEVPAKKEGPPGTRSAAVPGRLGLATGGERLRRHQRAAPPPDRRSARAGGPATRLLAQAIQLLLPDLIVAEAETSGVKAVASFDRSIERVPTVRRVAP